MIIKIREILKIYIIEIILGALILGFLNIRWFLFYFLTIYFINVIHSADAIRKMTKVYSFANEMKLMCIMKKLNITEEDVKKTTDELADKMTEEQKKHLQEDTLDVSRIG